MENKNLKVCYYCIHGRPRKNNLCSINKYLVKDVHTHTCDQYLPDKWLIDFESTRIESKQDDEGSNLVLRMAA